MNKVLWAKLLATFSALSAGASIVATRFVIPQIDPTTLAILRFTIGAICLSPFLIHGFMHNPITRIDWLKVIPLGVLVFGLFAYLFNTSLQYTTAAHGAVGLATTPIITLVLAWVLGQENMTLTKFICVLLAMLGVTIAVSSSLLEDSTDRQVLYGDMLMLLAALSISLYTIFAKPYIMKYGGIYFTAVVMMIGVLSLMGLSLATNGTIQLPDLSLTNWWTIVFLGIVGGAMQFGSYMWAMKWISPSTTAIALTLTPISAFLFAWPILGEPISLKAIIGLVLVVSAIIIMNRQPD